VVDIYFLFFHNDDVFERKNFVNSVRFCSVILRVMDGFQVHDNYGFVIESFYFHVFVV